MTDDNTEQITFQCIVSKVQTLADGGIRVTLDLLESAILEAAQLMECKRDGIVLNMTAKPRDRKDKVVIGNA